MPLSKIYVKARLIREAADQETGHIEGCTAAEALAAHLRVVVLGDPGGGKSTLCAWMAHGLAGVAASSRHPFQVPFLVVMREYAQRFEREQMSLARYLEAYPKLSLKKYSPTAAR